PLEELYVVVYLDALQVSIRDQQVVRKKAVYVAIGLTLEGERDCLGLWIEKTEGARFWTSVLTELRNRGVKDVLFVCTDGLTGFPEAINAVFAQAVNQTCIVHLVRQSLRYLSWRERRRCAGELRRIYTAADADAALRLIWLAIMRAKTNWRTCYNWMHAMAVLRIHFGVRIPDNT